MYDRMSDNGNCHGFSSFVFLPVSFCFRRIWRDLLCQYSMVFFLGPWDFRGWEITSPSSFFNTFHTFSLLILDRGVYYFPRDGMNCSNIVSESKWSIVSNLSHSEFFFFFDRNDDQVERLTVLTERIFLDDRQYFISKKRK